MGLVDAWHPPQWVGRRMADPWGPAKARSDAARSACRDVAEQNAWHHGLVDAWHPLGQVDAWIHGLVDAWNPVLTPGNPSTCPCDPSTRLHVFFQVRDARSTVPVPPALRSSPAPLTMARPSISGFPVGLWPTGNTLKKPRFFDQKMVILWLKNALLEACFEATNGHF